ncbi:50S ribosomal protein L19e [Methanosarcinales archaeon ex4572_44]|nr:MAG: 50S ribosomal protein L19e [Methanosarcinales archaeon ex4484_138]PHP46220.1 MAG: 50S ribosomal protein L19e [Methanosarcinales archaeon ex4572_44]RLG27713.1 MAG: 50S ribosomal protein L19e [Methanosarcinales archaeon]HHI30680.1 50S ribosomal protein L19e [Candidatus Methanoperedenaceae archaeon]
MTDLSNQRRLAAKILKVGLGRVWIDNEASEDIAAAITRKDVRNLIDEGKIKKRQIKGVSRGRARLRDVKRAYGHQRGHGTRKGAKGARHPRKRDWIKKIRAQRRRLRELRSEGTIDASTHHRLYRKAKGGEYRSVAHLEAHIELSKEQ